MGRGIWLGRLPSLTPSALGYLPGYAQVLGSWVLEVVSSTVGPRRMLLKLPRWQSFPQTYTVTWLFAKTGSDQLGECGGDGLSAVGLSTLRGLRQNFERPKKLHNYQWRAWT